MLKSPSLSSYERCHSLLKELSLWPCIEFAPVSPYLSCTGEPQAALSTPDVASPVRSGGEITSLLCLLVMYFFSVFTLLSTGAPRFLSGKLLSSLPAPGLYWCKHAVIALQGQDFALPFGELCGVPGSPFIQPVKIPPSSSTTTCCSHPPPSLVSSVSLLKVCCARSSR